MSSTRLEVVLQEELAGSVPMILDRIGNPIPCQETELRIWHLAQGLRRVSGARFHHPELSDAMLDATIAAIHPKEYTDFLTFWSSELGEEEMILRDHPYLPPGVAPDTPVVAGIYRTARESARTAITAALQVASGTRLAYALCRPPGHHASMSWLGGHCYLNNAVLMLHTLVASGMERVGLIDFDIHFGNGSAAILESWPNAFFGSIHSSTITSYPYMETHAPHERQRFIPFDDSPSPEEFIDAVEELVRGCIEHGASAIVVSAGYDIVDGDPHGTWRLQPELLEDVGRAIGLSGLPICVAQEGGYLLHVLEECAYRFGEGLLEGAMQAEREIVNISAVAEREAAIVR